MALTITFEMKDGVARVTLEGELDAGVAEQFRQVIENAAAQTPKRLVLFMDKLTFMASAGLRMLIYAKQKMGEGVDIYIIGAQHPVVRTLEMSGFHRSVYLKDTYEG
jgi:anti-anti-sigma factor